MYTKVWNSSWFDYWLT